MIYTTEVQHMCPVAKGAYHGPAPIPEEGKWVQAKQLHTASVHVEFTAFDGFHNCPPYPLHPLPALVFSDLWVWIRDALPRRF